MPDDEAVAADDADLSALTWVEDAVGSAFLAYMLGVDVDSISKLVSGETSLTDRQRAVVNDISSFRKQIPVAAADFPVSDLLSFVLTQVHESGQVVARLLRMQAMGAEEVLTSGQDELENSFIALALDAYPAFLLPAADSDLPRMPMMMPLNPRLSSLIFGHPKSKEFLTLALQDETLKEVFSEHNEHTGHMATVYRNTGSGGGLQLLTLPDMMLRNVWRHTETAEIAPEAFAREALKELRLVRDVLAGKARHISAKVGFAGVLMPPGVQFNIENGVVRAATDADRLMVPDGLKGQLSGTDQSGTTTVINYDGDVVLEYDYPYKVKIIPGLETEITAWPKDVQVDPNFDRTSLRLRFSLMLAVEREQRAQLVQTWRYFDEPLNQGYSTSWNDPRQGTAIMPVQLTNTEVEAWREWYERLKAGPIAKIELAFSRILRAIAERREPSDVLIDSVIAWENLFGTKEGEPTFRVTTCMAKLLAETVKDRLELKSRLGKIYTLRSKVVHGSGVLKDDEYSLCNDALDFAIRVVKVLVAERMDILELPDGAHRSAALLLGD